MQTRRIAAASALALGALLVTTVLPAQAQTTTRTYSGYAEASALSATVLGQQLAAGQVAAALDSTASAAAIGSGLLLGPASQGASSAAVAGADGTDGSPDSVCTPEDAFETISAALPLNLDLGLGCSSSQAAIANGLPSATATAAVSDSSANNPLSTLIGDADGAQALVDALRAAGADGPAIDAIQTAIDALGVLPLPIDLAPIVDQIAAVIGVEDVNLFNLVLGDTLATTSVADDGTVTSTCSADGARIDLFDLGETLGGPLVTITIGAADATVVASPDGADPTTTITPSLVRITGTSIATPIDVTLGQPVEIPLPEPIGPITIDLAAGTTGVDENGLTFATANGVHIGLLQSDALMGGIDLELAVCTAAAASATNITQVEDPTTTVAAPPLPRTGGNNAQTGAIALFAGLASLGVLAVRRQHVG